MECGLLQWAGASPDNLYAPVDRRALVFIEGGCLTDQMRRIDALGKKEHPLGLFFIKKDWVSCSDAIAQEIAVVVRHRRNTPLPRKRSKILLLFRCKGESETSFDLVSDD